MIGRLAAALLALATPAAAATVATATSPGGVLSVAVELDGDGRPSYRIDRQGRSVIAPSRLGFLLTDAPKLERGFKAAATATRDVDTSWEQPWGEWRTIRDRHRELRVTLQETIALARTMVVVFRLFDDGVGFRYEFPDQANFTTFNAAEELTQFAVAEPATAWWIPAFEWNREEYIHSRTPVTEVGTAQTPLTLKLASDLYVALHEAALTDFPAMNLAKVDAGLLKAVLTPSGTGPKAARTTPFATPWRTIQIAPDAPALYRSGQLILNLNEPNALGDVSWVKPMRYVGIWWGMHLDTQTWGPGPNHGATTANTLRMIDFAAAHGFGGVLVEGWNKGWVPDWFGTGDAFSFTRAYPDFDLPRIAAYAQRKGVTLIGHHETSGNIANYEAQLSDALDLYSRLGVQAVKTGYVADAGGIQARRADGSIGREWHEGQVMARHHAHVVQEAAKRRIVVNAHEPIKDSGLRRTYPNMISREGARGMEYNAWGSPKNPPEHEATLLFTRMMAGPMDFTPGIVSLKGRGGAPIPSTLAKQLALYVVLYSPIQMAADLPENYAKEPQAFDFIKSVPVDWDDTRVLAGEVGDHAVVARKRRGGTDWYVGAVSGAEARTLDLALDFLDPGRTYQATIYADGPGADWRTEARHLMVVTRRAVRRGDRLPLALAPGGGAAVRLTPR